MGLAWRHHIKLWIIVRFTEQIVCASLSKWEPAYTTAAGWCFYQLREPYLLPTVHKCEKAFKIWLYFVFYFILKKIVNLIRYDYLPMDKHLNILIFRLIGMRKQDVYLALRYKIQRLLFSTCLRKKKNNKQPPSWPMGIFWPLKISLKYLRRFKIPPKIIPFPDCIIQPSKWLLDGQYLITFKELPNATMKPGQHTAIHHLLQLAVIWSDCFDQCQDTWFRERAKQLGHDGFPAARWHGLVALI